MACVCSDWKIHLLIDPNAVFSHGVVSLASILYLDPNYISDMPMGFMPGSDDVNQFKKLDQTGQTDADIFGGIPPGGFGGEHGFGFGDRFGFGNGGHVGLSNFDPLNAMNFHTSTRRRRRFADGQKVTKVIIQSKLLYLGRLKKATVLVTALCW